MAPTFVVLGVLCIAAPSVPYAGCRTNDLKPELKCSLKYIASPYTAWRMPRYVDPVRAEEARAYQYTGYADEVRKDSGDDTKNSLTPTLGVARMYV